MYGVLADQTILLTKTGPERVNLPSTRLHLNLKQLYTTARRFNLKQIWIPNGTNTLAEFSRAKVDFDAAESIPWNDGNTAARSSIWSAEGCEVRPVKPFSANVVSIWVNGQTRSTVQLIFCGLTQENWSFDKVTDPVVLFNAIERFVSEIGVLPSFPQRTTQKVFEDRLKVEIPAAPDRPAEVFAPFVNHKDAQLIELRDLTREERLRGNLFAFDKRSMFLSACSSLPLAVGEYEKIGACDFNDVRGRVGLFSVEVVPLESGAMPPLVGLHYSGNRTVYHPELELLAKSATVKITGGLVAKQSRRLFESFYKLVSHAKKNTAEDPAESVKVANKAIKSLYTDFFGYLRKPELAESSFAAKWFRPDWRGTIISQAVSDLWRNIESVYRATGRRPVGILYDCLIYAADDLSQFENTVLLDSNRFGKYWPVPLPVSEAFTKAGKQKLSIVELAKKAKEFQK